MSGSALTAAIQQQAGRQASFSRVVAIPRAPMTVEGYSLSEPISDGDEFWAGHGDVTRGCRGLLYAGGRSGLFSAGGT